MNRKLHRVLDEIQKTEEKIAAWQEHLSGLNAQKDLLEDAEIIKSIRSMRLNSRKLLAVLEGVQNGTVTLLESREAVEKPAQEEGVKTMAQAETADCGAEVSAAENRMPGNTALEREDLEDEGKI